MADKVPLNVLTAFGPSRDQALLLASHPEEQFDNAGDPRPDRRTLILSLKGSKATFREERPVPLVRSWYSTGSGVGYCTSVATNRLYKWQAGKWSDEVFSEAPIDMVSFIFGLPGPTPEEDQLYLTTAKGLFSRSKGMWKRKTLRDKFARQIHGLNPSEIFIGADPLMKWDGKALHEVAEPPGQTLRALWVTSDDRLVGGLRSMHITTPEGGWEKLDVPTANYGSLAELGGTVFASSDDGMVQVFPPKSGIVGPPTILIRVVGVGDGLIATGETASLVYDGTTWNKIDVPLCEVGKRPF